FVGFARNVAEAALAGNIDSTDALLGASINGGTVDEARQTLVAKIGENIQVRRIANVTPKGTIGSYLHGTRIGVVVDVESGDEELARDLAMHIAASRPEYVADSDIPEAIVSKEKEILVAQAAESGKPPEIIEKMVTGRLRKNLSALTLEGQPFVKDPDVTVGKLLKGKGASVASFTRLEVGEGIEKKEENFAEEVMAQVRGD
ncbi:MAG: translation elongation factor Ts, partial [Pseudomonadota bacterium]